MDIPAADMQYAITMDEIIWGGMLVAVTMALHGLGMLTILRITQGLKQRFEPNPGFASGLVTLILASWMIMVVHLSEVVVWAGFFLWKGAFPTHSLAYYFSLNEYTTVGSNFSLPQRWRLLEGMIATAGLLTFAWSTGILLTLAQDFQDQQMRRIKNKRAKHSSREPLVAHASKE